MGKRKDRKSPEPEPSSLLRKLHQVYRTPGHGIERVSNPFDPRDNNVFYSTNQESAKKSPTPGQIARALRGQS